MVRTLTFAAVTSFAASALAASALAAGMTMTMPLTLLKPASIASPTIAQLNQSCQAPGAVIPAAQKAGASGSASNASGIPATTDAGPQKQTDPAAVSQSDVACTK